MSALLSVIERGHLTPKQVVSILSKLRLAIQMGGFPVFQPCSGSQERWLKRL
jgi:hypothetical protein